jgi:hypothetical protein
MNTAHGKLTIPLNKRSTYLTKFFVLISMALASILYAEDLSVYHRVNQDPGKIVILIDNKVFTCYRFGANHKYEFYA